MNLVIVESPAKAKTIEKILGKEYVVRSSFGHVRDLAKDGYKNTGVEVDNNYLPHYEIPSDKKKIVSELKKLVKSHENVILATDEDREGEAISWHLKEVLKLHDSKTNRITFTEITPPAIKAALTHPRKVDMALVNAQQARRVLDRLVGFELSNLLWKKVRGKLSAGRVQSVAVKLVVEREREIVAFKSEEQYKITAIFDPKKGQSFPAELNAILKNKELAQKFVSNCIDANFFVSSITQTPTTRKPSAPFTTSTLQQAAAQRLGFSVKRTMSAAQKLYEKGYITYMRTDSISISDVALGSIASFIEKSFGHEYLTVRKFKSKSKLAQEAHEAIRPSYIDKDHITGTSDEQRLYNLIRLRTLGSQMSEAKVDKTDVKITISGNKDQWFEAKGEVLIFDGFMRIYKDTPQALDDIILPDLRENDMLSYSYIQALQRFSKPPARYTEATLVKKLEELGIGRPSTYAPTIDKITSPSRGYVSKETREGELRNFVCIKLVQGKVSEETISEVTGSQKNKLFAKDMGMVVTDFLDDNFKEIMNYSFTAEVEDNLDSIAENKIDWISVIDTYYKPFTKILENALEKSEKTTGERVLGKHPQSGKTVITRLSKYGAVAQIGTPDELGEDEKPQYASLMPSQSLETITLDDALKLFEIPRTIGHIHDREIIVNRGRYGPYIKYGEDFISIPRTTDLYALTLSEAESLINQKIKEKAPIGTYKSQSITKGTGRFGPYIKWDGIYVSISKRSGYTLDTITEDQAIELIDQKQKKDAEKLIIEWKDKGIKIMKGRWGPFIKVSTSKRFYRLPKNNAGENMDTNEIKKLTFEEVEKIIKLQK